MPYWNEELQQWGYLYHEEPPEYQWLGFTRRQMKTIVYYHRNCFDGTAAAWVIRHHLTGMEMDTGNWQFIPVQYGDDKTINGLVQDCHENANINDRYIIVDFSFPRAVMELMASKAKGILVLDHHKTAEENCKGLDFCIFDMNQSGAGLAWRHLFPGQPVPNLVAYIEDRDLWKFELPKSKEINAFIQSYPQTISDYNDLYEELEEPFGLEKAAEAGRAIERYKDSMVKTICNNAVIKSIFGHKVPVVNGTLLFSEIGHRLCQMYPDHPFAASYFIRQDGKIQYSLRSIGDFDVSVIARVGGGGGHRNAAGFESYINVDVQI